MNKRPLLNTNSDSKTLKDYYYLKSELITFCKKYNLQVTGNKQELIERITIFLNTGEKTYKTHKKKHNITKEITPNTLIEKNIICSEKHRAFYKKHIGNKFTFNVLFQQWLKNNTGKTYQDSIQAYYEILEIKKKNKTKIDKQFEYNTYIRDFFNDNKNKTLDNAIKCWKYKKSIKGNNYYEPDDLKILDK